VRSLRADGLSLVLVEHDPGLIEAVSDEVLELRAISRAGG
jgi:ABC-type branched-subunit amino acid transport system ATPase component